MITVEELSLSELQRLLTPGPASLSYFGGKISGFIDAYCRDVETGETAWEIHQSNIFTDFGRRLWHYNCLGSTPCGIFTSGHSETPRLDRYSLHESYGGTVMPQLQAAAQGSVDWASCSKYWSNTFATPGTARILACIGLAMQSAQVGSSGITRVLAYSLLTPAKTQSTNQTLEISYRLTMTPSV